MIETERIQHALHAKTASYQRKIERAITTIHDMAQQQQIRWYCAYSGGIDSLVLLDLLYSLDYRIPVIWGDDGYDYHQTLHFLLATEERYHFMLTRVRSMDPWRDWCEEMGRPDLATDPEALAAWGNPKIWHHTWRSLSKDAPTLYDGVFLGMLGTSPKRGGESVTRQLQMRNGTRHTYQVVSEQNMWHCSPLAHLTKYDIWAYVVSRELPYNPVYDMLATLGVPVRYRRVGPLTCFRTVQYGSVVTLKAGWPAAYNRLAATFPMVRSYG